MDDLLGDGAAGGRGGDDDDFNPRAAGASSSGAAAVPVGGGDLESMLGDMSVGDGGPKATPGGAATARPTSQMIMDLARQSGAQSSAVTVPGGGPASPATPTTPSFDDLFGPGPKGSAEVADSTTNGGAAPSADAPVPLKKEVDPFADLLKL